MQAAFCLPLSFNFSLDLFARVEFFVEPLRCIIERRKAMFLAFEDAYHRDDQKDERDEPEEPAAEAATAEDAYEGEEITDH